MKKIAIICACLFSAIILAACSTMEGAVVGGIAGGLWGDARTGAAVGATIGAVDDMFSDDLL